MTISAADALELPVSERIQLVTEIWNSIAECPDAIELTEETRTLLIKRLAQFRADPTAPSPWHEVRERLSR